MHPILKHIVRFFTHTVWTINANSSGWLKQKSLMCFRIFLSSIFKFHKENEFLRVASLTYYTINSLVPLLAFMLWISTRFAIQKNFKNIIINFQPNYKELVETLFLFADNMLSALSNQVFLFVGVGFLLWSVFSLMLNIEYAINNVWGFKGKRGLGKRIILHFLIVGLFPFVMSFSVSIDLVMKKGAMDLIHSLGISAPTINVGMQLLFKFISYGILSIFFSLVYYIFPQRRIKWKSAFAGGIIAGLLFFLFQELYISSQIGVSRSNGIYGGFAAIPLFFLWVYASWSIILYGAHLSYHIENYPSFTMPIEEKMSIAAIKKLCLGIYRTIEKEGEKRTLRALRKSELAEFYITSAYQMDLAINYLVDAGLVEEYKDQPFTFCLKDLNKKYTDTQLLQKIENLYEKDIVIVARKHK